MAKLIITRSILQGQAFADKVCAAMPSLTDEEIIFAPLLEIRRVPIRGDTPKSYDGIIVTSANAIPSLLEHGGQGKVLYCVGEATVKAACEQGIQDIKIVAPTVADLIIQIQREPQPLHFCYFRGKHVSEDIKAALETRRHKVDEYICYDAVAVDCLSSQFIEAIKSDEQYVLTFFSMRTANVFTKLVSQSMKNHNIEHLKTLCMSKGVLNCLPECLQRNAYSAKTPDANGMLDLIRVHLV